MLPVRVGGGYPETMNVATSAPPDDPVRFDVPLYTIAEAARYLRVPESTFATWALGYERRVSNRRAVTAQPIISAVADGGQGAPRVPFIGLAEGQVVAALRRGLGDTRVSLQHIRRAVDVLRRELGLEHVLASKALYTDGAQLLYAYGEAEGGEELAGLTVLESGQRVFREVVRDYLRRLTYGDEWVTRLRPPVSTLLQMDPHVGAGRPLILGYGVPADAVIARLRAGDHLDAVAEDFHVPAELISSVWEALAG